MDRPTGNYTHERLIALEDSHASLLKRMSDILVIISPMVAQSDIEAIIKSLIIPAEKIRKEAGLE